MHIPSHVLTRPRLMQCSIDAGSAASRSCLKMLGGDRHNVHQALAIAAHQEMVPTWHLEQVLQST